MISVLLEQLNIPALRQDVIPAGTVRISSGGTRRSKVNNWSGAVGESQRDNDVQLIPCFKELIE